MSRFFSGSRYWIGLLFVGLTFETVALYYQYGLGYDPCVLCIHVRLWVAALMLLALAGIALHRHRDALLVISSIALVPAIGLLERSWATLGVERGWVMGVCSMELGLPEWFAVDRWLPSVFEALEACGYTPVLAFGITMAEALVATAGVLVLTSMAACTACAKAILFHDIHNDT